MTEKTETLLSIAQRFHRAHKAAYDFWDKGGIVGVWRGKEGVINISYENGQWFPYREEKGLVLWSHTDLDESI